MASCYTSHWASYSPRVELNVTETSSTDTKVTFSWTLDYYAPDSAASTVIAKHYTVTVEGATIKSGTYDINGKVGRHRITSGTHTVDKRSYTKAWTFGVSFEFNLTWSGTYGGTKSASCKINAAALTSYTITYNANGGSGAPASQTKTYGSKLTLSSTKPTRTGYTFKGWGTSASATTVAYAPGAAYTANAKVTLYAVWEIISYSVKYNANGGSGAPANQTKKYGTTLVLSSTEPTRTDYDFLGWATSASASTPAYDPGDAYTANAAVTLYAVWELAYIKPSIYNLSVWRCDADGTDNDAGTCGSIAFNWKCTNSVEGISIEYVNNNGETISVAIHEGSSDKSGGIGAVFGSGFSPDRTYDITVKIWDGNESKNLTTATITLNGIEFPIDVKAGGKGIAFGKPAELEGVADFGYEAKFNEPVYGKALGMDKLPEIPADSKLNDYLEPGCYAIYQTVKAKTIYCGVDENNEAILMGSSNSVPPAVAGRLEVWSATGEGIRLEEYSYIRQRFIPYNMGNAVWERTINRGSDNNWNYNAWFRTTLDPSASKKVYHQQKILWGEGMTNGYYMSDTQTATLSEAVSAQPNGIVLVFCAYVPNESTGEVETDYSWQSFFVPKTLVAASTSGHSFQLTRGNFASIGTKYLYIKDTFISGHADNKLTGTSNGITYANNKFVLRYVIGV